MTKNELIKIWKKFTENNDFILNSDSKHIEFITDGVLELERKHNLKLCPCRLRDGSRKKDLELLCPCNFKIQETWKKKSECWCGLFVKR